MHYHHSIALALAEARVADRQGAPIHRGSAGGSRRRDRRRLRALTLGLGVIAVLAPAGALAQPAYDMTRSRLTRRLARSVCALAASACIVLAIAAAATARPRPADRPQPVLHNSPAPTVVKETVVRPDNGGPDTIALVLIGVGAGAALLGAGYLGARIVTRTSGVPLTMAVSAESSTPTHRGPASRT